MREPVLVKDPTAGRARKLLELASVKRSPL
jgi:hypothetical protein